MTRGAGSQIALVRHLAPQQIVRFKPSLERDRCPPKLLFSTGQQRHERGGQAVAQPLHPLPRYPNQVISRAGPSPSQAAALYSLGQQHHERGGQAVAQPLYPLPRYPNQVISRAGPSPSQAVALYSLGQQRHERGGQAFVQPPHAILLHNLPQAAFSGRGAKDATWGQRNRQDLLKCRHLTAAEEAQGAGMLLDLVGRDSWPCRGWGRRPLKSFIWNAACGAITPSIVPLL